MDSSSKLFSGSQQLISSQNIDLGDILNKSSDNKIYEMTAKSVGIKKGIFSSIGDSQTVKMTDNKAINVNKNEIVVVDFDKTYSNI